MNKYYILNWFGITYAEFNAMVEVTAFDHYCTAFDHGEYASSDEDVEASLLARMSAEIQWAKSTGLVV